MACTGCRALSFGRRRCGTLRSLRAWPRERLRLLFLRPPHVGRRNAICFVFPAVPRIRFPPRRRPPADASYRKGAYAGRSDIHAHVADSDPGIATDQPLQGEISPRKIRAHENAGLHDRLDGSRSIL